MKDAAQDPSTGKSMAGEGNDAPGGQFCLCQAAQITGLDLEEGIFLSLHRYMI